MSFRSLAVVPARAARFLARRLASGGPQGMVDVAPLAACSPGATLATMHQTREAIAAVFLRGTGIEIGALHQPLRVPSYAVVKYVDRMSAADLRRQYEDLAGEALVEPDIIDNGETLVTFPDASEDFVVANHFLEHCQDPFRTLQNIFRVLKPGGVLYMVVPDKRFTFDAARPCTTIDHLMRDYTDGPAWSRRGHFEEWSRLVNKRTQDTQVEEEVQHLQNIDYSIHFHVWSAPELLEFIAALRQFVRSELEVFMRNGPETILVLRRTP